jgi:hypothetical protein
VLAGGDIPDLVECVDTDTFRVHAPSRVVLVSDDDKIYFFEERLFSPKIKLQQFSEARMLNFTIEELQSVVLCRRVGEKIYLDDGVSKRPSSSRNRSIIRALVILIEVIVGIAFIYYSLH